MSMARTAGVGPKVCRLCRADCAGVARVRDQFGRYYCKPCYQAEERRGRAAPSRRADPSATGTLMGLHGPGADEGARGGVGPVGAAGGDGWTIPLAPIDAAGPGKRG